jgi:AraC-like DNA-binding protein
MMVQLQELERYIRRHAHGAVTDTPISGLRLYFADATEPLSAQLVYQPMICIMVQGEKTVALGDKVFRYTPANYLIASVDLPVTGTVSNTEPGRPYLALSLAIDPALLADVMLTIPSAAIAIESGTGLGIGLLSSALLDCFVRLARLLDESPDTVAQLAPLIQREILFRLLQDENASMLRQVSTRDTRANGIAHAIRWIREHFAEPFSTTKLARIANMSTASFNRHFRAVTAMSALQYQKQIRLQEARRRLITQHEDAATAAFHVGYASPSQFSREYTRTFGKPPRQDTLRLHSEAAALL